MYTDLLPSIELAPTFYPSEEEFGDAIEYINSIRDVGEAAGICKIVPPPSWKPPFCIDRNKATFLPRVQHLNEIEAVTRLKVNFIDNFAIFWEKQGVDVVLPNINYTPLDVYLLHKTVQKYGGYEKSVKDLKWSQIARDVLLQSNLSYSLKQHYQKLLLPYVSCVLQEKLIGNRPRSKLNDRTSRQHSRKSNCCLVCGKICCSKYKINMNHDQDCLECISCHEIFHLTCLPHLRGFKLKRRNWNCLKCVKEICLTQLESIQYIFAISKYKYTLNEFKKKSDNFMDEYRRKLGDVNKVISCEELEKQFWTILGDPTSSMEVEYGADLSTSELGSGFPIQKLGKYKKYCNSWWNLNKLPDHPLSILSYIKEPISGMKIPWLYIGMLFSCFCWHVEDHWTCSINYLHEGSIKTWYGIPASSAERFENLLKEEAEELFNVSPDLMHQLATTLHPGLIKHKGIPIYKVFQQAGEYVVTFSRGYHAGFNQGYNCAEAVNFSYYDWFPLGRKCIQHYRSQKRMPVLSHDGLVLTVAQSCCSKSVPGRPSANLIEKLIEEILVMSESLKASMKKIKQLNIKTTVLRHLVHKATDDELVCSVCKHICYLAAIVCSNNKAHVYCPDHSEYTCKCGSKKLALQIFITLEDLNQLTAGMKNVVTELPYVKSTLFT